MLIETGSIVEIESDALTVQVIQQTTCGSCSAQKGCGQGVLTKYLSGSQFVRIALKNRPSTDFKVGDQVELGIDELAMLKAAFLVYLTPLLMMVAATYLGSLVSELTSILAAVVGLIVGGFYVRRESTKRMDDPGYAPVVIDDKAVVRIFSQELA